MKKKIIIIAAAVVLIGVVAVVIVLSGGDKEEPPVVLGMFSPGESFVLNTPDGKALFKCAMMLTVDKEYLTAISGDEVMAYFIRDTILLTLRTLDLEELRDTGAVKKIKDRIVSDLNAQFNEDYETQVFYDVYFSDFVIQ